MKTSFKNEPKFTWTKKNMAVLFRERYNKTVTSFYPNLFCIVG